MVGFTSFGGEMHLGDKVQLFNGDSREVLRRIPDNSIDSVVTDPPYALVSIVKRFGKVAAEDDTQTSDRIRSGADGYARAARGFMGQTWDTGETAFAVEFWAEVMRVLKPGGHVIAASGTRTYHRLACAIEDAGFEIRDMALWLYGSGFPKSHDVSKGIDKAAGAVREIIGPGRWAHVKAGGSAGVNSVGLSATPGYDATAPATPEAAQWQGWGTALKPACEPWVLARKPLIGTVAANVLAHGTGALNIDGCRVGDGGGTRKEASDDKSETTSVGGYLNAKAGELIEGLGRWPANVIHDGSEEVATLFPDRDSPQPRKTKRSGGVGGYGGFPTGNEEVVIGFGDSGSAARFFYSAKADALDRIGSKHPTVKPVDLMQYLCRLITPPGGIVLDPFAGSGSTGEAAWREGFRCVLIEREADYADDIRERLRLAPNGIASKRRAIAAKKANPIEDGLSVGLF